MSPQAALDALGQKRRKIALARSGPASRSVEAFSLNIDRYQNAVKNLGTRVSKSKRAVFTQNGQIGARFASAGLLNLEEITYKSYIYSVGSGGPLRYLSAGASRPSIEVAQLAITLVPDRPTA